MSGLLEHQRGILTGVSALRLVQCPGVLRDTLVFSNEVVSIMGCESASPIEKDGWVWWLEDLSHPGLGLP